MVTTKQFKEMCNGLSFFEFNENANVIRANDRFKECLIKIFSSSKEDMERHFDYYTPFEVFVHKRDRKAEMNVGLLSSIMGAIQVATTVQFSFKPDYLRMCDNGNSWVMTLKLEDVEIFLKKIEEIVTQAFERAQTNKLIEEIEKI